MIERIMRVMRIMDLSVLDPAGETRERLELRRAWPRSRSHLALEYVDGRGGSVAGQWMADASRLEEVAKETARRCPAARPFVVQSAAGPVLLQPDGADRRLIGLRALLARADSTLVSHRPERRAVVRLNGSSGPRFAKVLRPSRVRDVAESSRAAWSLAARPFAVPEVLHGDERQGVLILGALGGTSLHDLLADGDSVVPAARNAGRATRWLHDAPLRPERVHDAEAEITLIEARIDALETFAPDVHNRLGDAPARVAGALREGAGRPGLVHRDLHDKQIVVQRDGTVGMLDLDTMATGEPALDVANMLVHFELRALQGRCAQQLASRAAAAFLEGYEPGADMATRIDAYRNATRLRLACLYALRPPWRHLAPKLLERIKDSDEP